MALLARARFTVLSPISFHRPTPMDPYVAGGAGTTARCSRRPDWVLLHESARISGHRNTTTAASQTAEGQPVEVSFWLVDPPGVSYFSVNFPGLDSKELADEPQVLCAEAALVLFSVTFVPVPPGDRRRVSTQHFVYRAGPGSPSLHLIPDPEKITRGDLFGLLPVGETGNYAVVFLNKQFIVGDMAWRFDLHAFSSVTQSWSSKVPLSGLSEDDQKVLLKHGTCKQIMVGGSSLGWVDLFWGILLVCDVFGECPVIKYISLPASRVCHMDERDHYPYIAPEYCCDVSCCDNLIKFVEVEFDDRDRRTLGNQGWKVTTWKRDISWDDWRQCFTVDVANISVDPSYSDLLPGLWNDKAEKLELKKLVFYTLTLSKHDDNFLYVMCKANSVDGEAWVITVDMEHAVVEAIAPYSTIGRRHVSWHSACTFPKYLDLNPGDDVTMHSKRISMEDFVHQVLLTLDWFRELDARLEFGGPTLDDCLSLLHCCPVSPLLLDMQEVVKYTGQGRAAAKAVDFCSRVLKDFDMHLRKSVGDPSLPTEAMRSRIRVALRALDSILNIVPPSPRLFANACHQKRDTAIFELCEKADQKEDCNLQDLLSHRKKPDKKEDCNLQDLLPHSKKPDKKEDCNLQELLPHSKKPDHRSNDSRGNKKKRARGRKANRDEQSVCPSRLLEQSRSPSCLLIFVCLLSAPFILKPIVMKSFGYHPSV